MKVTPFQRIISGAFLLGAMFSAPLVADRFYPDDPLWKMPPPRNVQDALKRKLSDYYEFLVYPFAPPGELNGVVPEGGKEPVFYRAEGVNTLGEVPNNSWYENRNYFRPMSKEEIQAGPGNADPPPQGVKWIVWNAKAEGVTPGFYIKDQKGNLYLLKFDPPDNNEMATAADTLVSKIFYALGYFVPENYIVYFHPDQLEIQKDTKIKGPSGEERLMTRKDIIDLALQVERMPDGRYRASASRFVKGKDLGPHRYFGTRKDDPNDIYRHEHRRDQRGLGLMCAWLGHDDSRDVNTIDFLMEEDGTKFIKHYLIDFGSTLGSASVRPNSPRSGNYLFSWDQVLTQAFTFGSVVPDWARAKYPDYPSVGRFEWKTFDPETWRPEYINPAFFNALPDDDFWAAKQIMAFTDDQIRWAVETGQYSNAAARDWVVECLIKRRDKIGRVYFAKVLPLDRFRVESGSLAFDDLGAIHGMYPARTYKADWAQFNNETGESTPISGASGLRMPEGAAIGSYYVARLFGDNEEKDIRVTVRRESAGWKVVGVERGWIGKSKLRFVDSSSPAS